MKMIDDRTEIVKLRFDHKVIGFIRRKPVARPQIAMDEAVKYNK